MEEPLLEITGLRVCISKYHQEVPVIHHLNLCLHHGEVLGIAGESGSGKTITALAIMNLLPPGGKITQGQIQFQSPSLGWTDLRKCREQDLYSVRGKEIAMIFQEPMTSLNPTLTCGYQVSEVLRIHRDMTRSEAAKKAIQLLAETRLEEPENVYLAYPHQLSGGQRQRVMIAMAIAADPVLLIADEPTTALDVTVQQSVLGSMKELQKKYGMGMLFITHDLDLITDMSDKVIIMRHGRVVESGKVHDILSHPEDPYTAALLACKPPLERRPEKLPSVPRENGGETAVLECPSVSPEERKKNHATIYSSDPVLQVRKLGTTFSKGKLFGRKPSGERAAVTDVSFDLYAGETLGLVGESGSGKTTLGRTILRLINSSAGEVRYKGRVINTLLPADLKSFRQEVQIIFQDPFSSLNPRMTIGQMLTEPLAVHKIIPSEEKRMKAVIDMLEHVRLEPGHFYRYPHEFSGGQRQRIVIARALVMRPQIVICDEPVSSLDVSVQADILNLLNELKKEFNLTYLFISHDLAVVRYMSDRVMVMKNGTLVETGEADKVYTQPESEYTRSLIDAIPGKRVRK